MRKRVTKKVSTRKHIAIICEGDTEKTLLSRELEGYQKNMTYFNVGGGGYKDILTFIEKYSALAHVLLVVCDLDRANNPNSGEKTMLYRLIKKLVENSEENNIFFTNPNIEYWIACAIGLPWETDVLDNLKSMGYAKGKSVNRFIKKHNGSFDKAKGNAQCEKLFFRKETIKQKPSIKTEYISELQSNLVYLKKYISELNK